MRRSEGILRAMSKTIVVCGYGTGISAAVVDRFAKEGFSVALVARNAERLAAGVKALEARGVKAAAFPTDLGDPAAVRAMIGKARAALGTITIVQWTAYAGAAGDLLTADAAAVRNVYDVAVTGLLAAVQEALPDLKKEKGAVLVTNGGLGYFDPKIDAMAVAWGAMGLGVANAAKHKLVGLLAEKLKADGVYVGEVMVLAAVKGTVFDQGNATIEASTVAERFWDLYSARKVTSVEVA